MIYSSKNILVVTLLLKLHDGILSLVDVKYFQILLCLIVVVVVFVAWCAMLVGQLGHGRFLGHLEI